MRKSLLNNSCFVSLKSKGDGVAKTGAAVGALAGLGLMLLAVGVSVVMIRRKRSA